MNYARFVIAHTYKPHHCLSSLLHMEGMSRGDPVISGQARGTQFGIDLLSVIEDFVLEVVVNDAGGFGEGAFP